MITINALVDRLHAGGMLSFDPPFIEQLKLQYLSEPQLTLYDRYVVTKNVPTQV